MAGSAFMLVGCLATVFLYRNETGVFTFNVVEIANSQAIAASTTRWLFLAFAIAFAVKVPLFPLHTWLPDAHTNAPTAGSVILAGVMLKLGTYGFLRYGLYLFPDAAHWWAPLFITLGVLGVIYGAICATMQRDLKRLVAYSSVAHLGFIILGTFALTTEASRAASSRWSTTACRPAPCSSSSAGSTNGATPARSPSCAVCRRWRPSSPPPSPW
jgi:NADH-quinone oxidoreductase subunit M